MFRMLLPLVALLILTAFPAHAASDSNSLSYDLREDIKNQIIQLAKNNMTRVENREPVRRILNTLTEELALLSPPMTEERIGQYSPGSWWQIWADERDNSPPGAPQQDLAKIFQYVSTDGWAYNFGVRNISESLSVTFALEVAASLSGNEQTTRIVKGYSRGTTLARGESIANLAISIHSGRPHEFQERDFGEFPRGPIGAESILTIKYIDEDLKIGIAPNVYTGELEMFVLERSDGVQ